MNRNQCRPSYSVKQGHGEELGPPAFVRAAPDPSKPLWAKFFKSLPNSSKEQSEQVICTPVRADG